MPIAGEMLPVAIPSCTSARRWKDPCAILHQDLLSEMLVVTSRARLTPQMPAVFCGPQGREDPSWKTQNLFDDERRKGRGNEITFFFSPR